MRVEIVAIHETLVEVRSELGAFVARWHGAPPPVGSVRSVELDVDDSLTWGVDAVPVEPRPHAIARGPDDGVVLWAMIERLGEDGYVGLRLGPSIVMLDAVGVPPPLGATVRIEARAVTLFDTNI
jgi:hypothetical protein